MPSQELKSDRGPSNRTVGLLVAGVIVVLVVSAFVIIEAYGNPESPGTFGDMFGAANALFSALAFVGVVYAILLQRREIHLQGEELRQTKEELMKQREQMELQNQTLCNQSFENTFFQLLRLHNEMVAAMETKGSGAESNEIASRGRSCFVSFLGEVKRQLQPASRKTCGQLRDALSGAYMDFYERHQSDLGHYFRSLYNTVKLVDRSPVADKRLYTNLIRAQLSSYELALLFYNCLSELGYNKFKPLLEKYSMLKNMPLELLCHRDHMALYEAGAFGGTYPDEEGRWLA